jgi:hypothetical protein
MPLQIEVADNLGPEEAVDVCCCRNLEAGPQLLGDAGAAQNLSALQHQDLDTGFGQVRGSHKTVVTAADNDEVVRRGHARLEERRRIIAPPGAAALGASSVID